MNMGRQDLGGRVLQYSGKREEQEAEEGKERGFEGKMQKRNITKKKSTKKRDGEGKEQVDGIVRLKGERNDTHGQGTASGRE